jgi:hypothetical protein
MTKIEINKTLIWDFLKDIRVIIILFFLFRLYGITNAPLEPASTWRQCDGLMIARNFYEHNPNILYPTVDVGGEKSGIVGSEFPLLNYLTYLISLPFGFQDWLGRLINLLVSSLATYFFYRLIKNYFSEAPAFYATIVLLVSMWFGYSRITIPDIFSASLCIIAAYFAFQFLEKRKTYQLAIYFLLALAGCLAKVSAASLLAILAVPMFMARFPLKLKVILSATSAMVLVGTYYWYFVWVPHLNTTYGFDGHFFMGMPISESINLLITKWPETLKKFYDTPLKYSGFITFLVCVFIIIKNKQWPILISFLIPFVAFMMVVLKSGVGLIVNSYYPIMFVPPMAFIIGCGLPLLFSNRKIIAIVLLIISIEGVANQLHTFQIREPNKLLLRLEPIMDSVSKREDLIAINASETGTPQFMYFAHRKGWNITNENLQQPEIINDFAKKGCKYILILKEPFDTDLNLNFEKVHESEYFKVYKLPHLALNN